MGERVWVPDDQEGECLAAECPIVPGNQPEVEVTFSAKVLGLHSQLPIELEPRAMWRWGGSTMGRAASDLHLLPAD